ncbi:hypothetical protein CMI44_01380 [Candidatus Pacearchaeota archaeon]|jgi:RNase P subunit RPR2|nr:hypothetical protein [Candidatus Pacearchaeota archaeon]
MKKTISKSEAKKQVEEFFNEIKNKPPHKIKKIKRLAMAYNLPLKEKRKLFCKKCLNPYKAPRIRIKNKMKFVECGNCGGISRWRL